MGRRNGGSGGFMVGLLAGTAMGAALALLLAPRAGSAMRRDVSEGVDRFGENAKAAWDEVATITSDALNKGKEAYQDALKHDVDSRTTTGDTSS